MSPPASFESPVMIGRTTELGELREALRAAVDGRPAAVLVEGEAGIGKSRLVREFGERVGRTEGALVLIGRCVEFGGEGPPYAPFVPVLRDLVRVIGPTAVRELAQPGVSTLAALVPELDTDASTGTAPDHPVDARDDEPTEHRRGRLFEIVAALLARAASRRPVVLVVEDLHDSDPSTRDLFRFLIHALDSGNVLLVGTCRSDALHRRHPLRGYLAELDRSRQLRRIGLNRLTAAEVSEQLAAILPEPPAPEVAHSVHQRAEGIPFFVEELVAAGSFERPDAPLPWTLRDLLLARFEQLGDAAQRVLRLLATGPPTVPSVLLAAVHGGEDEELDQAVREAISVNILRVVDDGYAFRHALVREAVADDLLPGERVRQHVRYAEALSADPGLAGHPDRAMAEAAYHWFAAHHNERAFVTYAKVLHGSVRTHGYHERHLAGERLLELWDRVPDPAEACGHDHTDLLVTTAVLATESGEYDRAGSLLDAALAELDPTAEPERYADTLRRKALAVYADGCHGDGRELLTQALALVPRDPPSELRGRLLHQLSTQLMLLNRFADAIPVSEEAIEVAEALGVDAIASHAYNTRGTARAQLGDTDAGMADLRRAGELGHDSPQAMHRFYVNYAHLHAARGNHAEALRISEQGLAYARSLGVARTQGSFLAANTAYTLLMLGEWDRAEEVITEALELDPPFSNRSQLLFALAELAMRRGNLDRANELIATGRGRLVDPTVDPHRIETERWQVAQHALESGRSAEAADQLLELARSWSKPNELCNLLAQTARALGQAGRITAEVANELSTRADETGHAGVPPWRQVLTAELSGQDPDAWRIAREAAQDERAPADSRAYTAYRHGEALLTAGDRTAGRAALADAERIARDLGAGLILGRVEALRVASGLADTPDASDAVGRQPVGLRSMTEPLTNRERQVLALVAEGLSNRQIGERLFISTKTASVHVSNLLRKLDASTRTEAAANGYARGLLAAPAPSSSEVSG